MLSFFPRDVLDGLLDLIGSVSEGFPTYFSLSCLCSENGLYSHTTMVITKSKLIQRLIVESTSYQCCFKVSTQYACFGRPSKPACVYIWCGVEKDVLSCANSEDQPAF